MVYPRKLKICLFVILQVISLAYSSEGDIRRTDIEEIIPKLNRFIDEGMKESHVPGIAVAIVFGDEVIHLKGFGYRNVNDKQEVTPDTIFQIASVSKPITSTVLAAIVGEGKIDWKSKIENLNPSFRLSDPWVTSQITIRDLLSHRSGLPDHAGDILEDLGFDQETIFYRLRYIRHLNAFREDYAYTNFGFSEAGYAVSKHLGVPWNELAKEKLFSPLGMSETSYSFDDYVNSPRKATTYFIDKGTAQPLKIPRRPDAQGPAGGVSSSANDIAKWMILQMGGFQQKNIVNETALKDTQSPVIVTGRNEKTGLPTFYGMGWDVSLDTEGRYFLKHSGSFYLGVRSQVVLLPKEKIGITILANANPTGLPEAISQTFFDLLFKGEITEGIVTKYNELWMNHQVDPQVIYQKSKDSNTPPLTLESYTGKYKNDYYGTIEIRKQSQGLELLIGPQPKIFSLKHLNRDVFTFKTEGENRVGETQVIFSMDEQNNVRQITIDYLNKFGMGIFIPK